MQYSFQCPSCHETLLLDEEVVGMKVRCSECGHKFKVTRSGRKTSSKPRESSSTDAPADTEPAVSTPHVAPPAPALMPQTIVPSEPPPEAVDAAERPPIGSDAPSVAKRAAPNSAAPPRVAAATASALGTQQAGMRAGISAAFHVADEAGRRLSPRARYAAGVIGMLIAAGLPFYASAAPDLPRPAFSWPWSTGAFENRLLLILQISGVVLAVIGLVWQRRKWLQWLAVFGIAAAFCDTWLLAAERARELSGPTLSISGARLGLSWGAGLFLAANAVCAAAAVASQPGGYQRKPWRRCVGGTILAFAVLAVLGITADRVWLAAGFEPIALDASPLLARNVSGMEIADSVAIRVQITNRGTKPLAIVARRGGQYDDDLDGVVTYWLRVKARSSGDPRWRRLPRPAWSGPWPALDFRASRVLAPGESWQLEAPVFRRDVSLIRGSRPDLVTIELTDATRCWFQRRQVKVD